MKKILFILFVSITLQVYGQNYPNLLNYNNNGTITNGIKIKTNIPYTNLSHMPTVTITGYDYNRGTVLGLNIVWYVSSGTFNHHSVSTFGGFAPPVYLANEDNKVVIFLDLKTYFLRFTVSAFAQKGNTDNPEWYSNWTAADEAVGELNKTLVPYKNNFSSTTIEELSIGKRNTADIGSITRMSIIPYYGAGTWNLVSRDDKGTAALDFKYNDNLIYTIQHTGKIGIGTNNPRAPLEVGGTLRTQKLLINTIDGTVSSPLAPLHVESLTESDASILATSSEHNRLVVRSEKTSPIGCVTFSILQDFNGYRQNGYINFHRGNSTNGGFLSFGSNGIERLRINAAGNVGIGTVSPEYKLDVVGSIRAHIIKVNTDKGADFVFGKEYKLRPLTEVEQFIAKNQHLPDVTPADSMIQNGIDMGDMQITLLQKVEELTLYLIEQEKRMSEQQKTINLQSEQINILREQISSLTKN